MTTRYPIEKGIPIPPSRGNNVTSQLGTGTAFPFAQMDVGDSFFIPTQKTQASFSRQLQDASMIFRMGYTTRQIRDDQGIRTGIRVWRTK